MDSQTIVNTMEVLETKPISELCQEVIIKVCYVSDAPNRNDTVITREVGKQIAASLPGAPVAGFYNEQAGDFEEHSHRITIQSHSITIEDITRPYGFVSLEQPWYQDFVEDGETRTYLMCKAYLWTRQYEEAQKAINKGQSMELDERTMAGYYDGDVFVFTNAVLEKLCILGDNFEPCFEGARIITSYSKQYESLAEQLENTLGRRYYVMDNKLVDKTVATVTLEYAIELGWPLENTIMGQLYERGMDYTCNGVYSENGSIYAIVRNPQTNATYKVDVIIHADETIELATTMSPVKMSWIPNPTETEPTEPINNVQAPVQDPIPAAVSYVAEDGTAEEPATEPAAEFIEADPTEVVEEPAAEFTEADPTEVVEEPAAEFTEADPTEVVEEPAAEFTEATEDYVTEVVAKYEVKVAELEAQISTLTTELDAYKAKEVEMLDAQKDAVISSYKALLTDEEMADVVENKGEYSLDDIEAKLAIKYANKAKANPNAAFQVDLSGIDQTPNTDNLPEFMKQALEIDSRNAIRLIS